MHEVKGYIVTHNRDQVILTDTLLMDLSDTLDAQDAIALGYLLIAHGKKALDFV